MYCILCNADTTSITVDGQEMCQTCYETRCYRCMGELGSHVMSFGDRKYCSRCYRRQVRSCGNCGKLDSVDNLMVNPDGEYCCTTCFAEVCTTCHACGGTIWLSNCTYYDDFPYCRGCFDRIHREWDGRPFVCENPTYRCIESERRFGVELETSECPGHGALHDSTIWSCKTDVSIDGLEFISPVLYGDQGLENIEDFCEKARNRYWQVNHRCGYHAHFDLTNETWQELRSIAYAYRKTYSMWSRFVSDGRCENSMCGTPRYRCEHIANIDSAESWEYFVAARDRFEFLNWRAYLVHGTLEIRTHDATLEADEVCNWIMAHARFIDYVSCMSLEEINTEFGSTAHKNFRVFSSIVGPALSKYYAGRAERFEKPVIRPTLSVSN